MISVISRKLETYIIDFLKKLECNKQLSIKIDND